MRRPSAWTARTTQLLTDLPSMRTAQAPHTLSPHPYLTSKDRREIPQPAQQGIVWRSAPGDITPVHDDGGPDVGHAAAIERRTASATARPAITVAR